MKPEEVVLVDEKNNPLGTAIKSEVHQKETLLHRAFSLFLFHPISRKFLIQQRAYTKITWPGVWSSSVCGHPAPNEATEDAIKRRLSFELGTQATGLTEIIPDYRYCANFKGVQENEFCPVWVGWGADPMMLNPEEVAEVDWVDWDDFSRKIVKGNDPIYKNFSPWCQEETVLLTQSEKFAKWLENTG